MILGLDFMVPWVWTGLVRTGSNWFGLVRTGGGCLLGLRFGVELRT